MKKREREREVEEIKKWRRFFPSRIQVHILTPIYMLIRSRTQSSSETHIDYLISKSSVDTYANDINPAGFHDSPPPFSLFAVPLQKAYYLRTMMIKRQIYEKRAWVNCRGLYLHGAYYRSAVIVNAVGARVWVRVGKKAMARMIKRNIYGERERERVDNEEVREW